MKTITQEIINQLRYKSRSHYPEKHIQKPTAEYGQEKTAELIERIVRFTGLLPRELSDVHKATLMYQLITETVSYDHNKADTTEKYSYTKALYKGSAVCLGIAELYHILCTACGLKSRIVNGYCTKSDKDDAYHAWTQIRITDSDGKTAWYMFDPTWDLKENKHAWKYFMKNDSYFQMNGHYWMTGEYEHCEFSLEHPEPYPDRVINRVIEIFREIVCAD